MVEIRLDQIRFVQRSDETYPEFAHRILWTFITVAAITVYYRPLLYIALGNTDVQLFKWALEMLRGYRDFIVKGRAEIAKQCTESWNWGAVDGALSSSTYFRVVSKAFDIMEGGINAAIKAIEVGRMEEARWILEERWVEAAKILDTLNPQVMEEALRQVKCVRVS